jgi:hypothetical protein
MRFFHFFIGGYIMAVYRTEKDFLKSLQRFNALSSRRYEWHTGKSEKEHTCEFGHTIPPEHLYFKKPLDIDGEQKLRICSTCMETLVYLTVDCDMHSKKLIDRLYLEKNPPLKKTAKAVR